MDNSNVDFLDQDHWIVTKTEKGPGIYIVHAVADTMPTGCMNCSSTIHFLQKHGRKPRKIDDIPIRGMRVVLHFNRQRYMCLRCRATVFQPLPGIDGNRRLTARLVEHVATRSVYATFSRVAEETWLSETTVRNAFYAYSERVLETRSPATPISLGLDDVYVGRIARCVLVDNNRGRVYELLPGIRKTSLYRVLLQIPDRGKIAVCTIDMSHSFRDAIKQALPSAVIVVDKFHIQRMANRAVSTVRRSIKPEKKSSKSFTRDPFLILRNPEGLRDDQKTSRDNWFKESPLLHQAYLLQRSYLQIWNIKDRRKAEEAYDAWVLEVPPELIKPFSKLTTAMKNWRQEVFNYWDYAYTNAYCESHNNIIKEIQRRGRSYDFATVRALVLCRDMLKNQESIVA